MLRKIIALQIFTFCYGFFDFLRSSGASVDQQDPSISDPHPIRGIPDFLLPKYQEVAVFSCDLDKVIVPRSAINDGYCDCIDGSDEPGTSACSNGQFYCRNKGYKLIKLASSRVDDSVCDCCDGSDEGVIITCPNTCRQAAEKERGALERATQAYRAGKSARMQMAQKVLLDSKSVTSQYQPAAQQEISLKGKLSELKQLLNDREALLNAGKAEQVASLQHKTREALQLRPQDLSYQAQYLSALLEVLEITEDQLSEMLTYTISEPEPVHHEEDDGYGDADAVEDIRNPTTCDIIDLTSNPTLSPLCHAADKLSEVNHVLNSILKAYKPYAELLLILGFYQVHQTFAAAADLSRGHMTNPNWSETCPQEFSNLGEHCNFKEIVRPLVDSLTSLEAESSQDPEITKLKDEISRFEGQLKEVERIKQEAQNAIEELKKFENWPQFLAMKGQCFDVVDGKFSYSLCPLDSVKQKEIEGHNSVSLGQFSSIEESDHNGHSFKIRFNNGQYCYNHGPRQAEVSVTCGANNVLKGATEPSICSYSLEFESPAACTDKYAQSNGINP